MLSCRSALGKSTGRRRLRQSRIWHVLLWWRVLAQRKVLDLGHLRRLNRHVRWYFAVGLNPASMFLSSLWVPAFRSRTHQAAIMGHRLCFRGIKVSFLDIKHGIGPKLELRLPSADDGLMACFRKALKFPGMFRPQAPYPPRLRFKLIGGRSHCLEIVF